MKSKYSIELKNITKLFGNFKANDNISLKIKRESIHAIIGENGAGKSTLMNQIFGLLRPTFGSILINGEKVNISGPNDSANYGLSMVHQHFQLVENHSVLENIILGNEKTRILSKIDYRKAKYKLLNISKKYKFDIDPDMLVKNLSVGVQQRIEILKMLYRGAKILIFDEPTSMLTPQEIEGLLALFIDLKKKGKTIIFISHKLNEVKQVADTGTVIRNGKLIKNFEVYDTTTKKMAEYMVGKKVIPAKNNKPSKIGKTILSIENISVKHYSNSKALGLKDFSLNVKEGEIVAIAGVEGNGQLELINAIFGLQKYIKGNILILSNFRNKFIKNKKGEESKYFMQKLTNNIKSRYEHALSLVPEDRYKFAMLKNENLFTNIILQTFRYRPFSIFGFLTKKPKVEWTHKVIKEFDVRGSRGGASIIGDLSGGNQQKFIIGREMTRKHKLLILFQPTRGLDIGAIKFIHEKIIKERNKGNAVLLVSYDLNEIMALADRVVVLNQGNLIKIANIKGLPKEQIGKWMAGIK